MSESFVVLWTLERCRWLRRVGDEGPIEVVFGGLHTSLPSIAAVRPGDSIYPVAVVKGDLLLLARLVVDRIVSPEDFVRERLGIELGPTEMWDILFETIKKSRPDVGHRVPTTCADHAAVGRGSPIRFDQMFRSSELALLRLGPKEGREQPLTGVIDGRLKNNLSLQGHLRRLSHDSAARIASLMATG